MVKPLLTRWDLADLFNWLIQGERTRAYKPSPVIYRVFLEFVSEPDSEACLVSSNFFDVAGTKNMECCGLGVLRSL